jgi:hypothetical protein
MSARSIILVLGFFIIGCSVPVVQQVAAPEPQPLPPGAITVALKLTRVVIEVPKGTVVGELREGPECASKQPLVWKFDTLVFNDGEYHTTFDQVLGQYNFIPGRSAPRSPTALFDAPVTPAVAPAGEMLVGARITNLRQNDCMNRGFFSMGSAVHKGSGRFSVHWEVYSPKEQKVILTMDNEGSGTSNEFKAEGDPGYLANAFASALKGLLRNEEFRRLVTSGRK